MGASAGTLVLFLVFGLAQLARAEDRTALRLSAVI